MVDTQDNVESAVWFVMVDMLLIQPRRIPDIRVSQIVTTFIYSSTVIFFSLIQAVRKLCHGQVFTNGMHQLTLVSVISIIQSTLMCRVLKYIVTTSIQFSLSCRSVTGTTRCCATSIRVSMRWSVACCRASTP